MKPAQTTIIKKDSYYNPTYNSEPFTDFKSINPSTDLDKINLNWTEKDLPERVRTKHVHRLHPYLGKFIPQLVEIFLRKYNPSVVYDPFCGSGTTLVEAKSLGMDSIGSDISEFNALLTKVKTDDYDLRLLEKEIKHIIKWFKIKNGDTLYKSPKMETDNEYLNKWYSQRALHELLLFKSMIKDYHHQDVMRIILSRSARSARLTTHYDLAFPKKPQTEPYFCRKHGRICTPVNEAEKFLSRYAYDTLKRIKKYSKLKKNASVDIYNADSAEVEIPNFDLIFTSPPYLGLIDYHEQHRYAYELLALQRKDDKEIGPAFKGKSEKAKKEYVEKIYDVYKNALNYLNDGGRIITVVSDKKDLYSKICEKLNMILEKKITRHVNRRTGRSKSNFFEEVLIWRN